MIEKSNDFYKCFFFMFDPVDPTHECISESCASWVLCPPGLLSTPKDGRQCVPSAPSLEVYFSVCVYVYFYKHILRWFVVGKGGEEKGLSQFLF